MLPLVAGCTPTDRHTLALQVAVWNVPAAPDDHLRLVQPAMMMVQGMHGSAFGSTLRSCSLTLDPTAARSSLTPEADMRRSVSSAEF